MFNHKNLLLICIIYMINLELSTAVATIKEGADCKCCKTKVDAGTDDCQKTNTIRVEATVMTLTKKTEQNDKDGNQL